MAQSTKRFQRRVEDFICGYCGTAVHGDGYTNHCPACLWSRHVDIHPGDRQASCSGLMEPIGIERRQGSYRIRHRCTLCGMTHVTKTSTDDNYNVIVELSAQEPR